MDIEAGESPTPVAPVPARAWRAAPRRVARACAALGATRRGRALLAAFAVTVLLAGAVGWWAWRVVADYHAVGVDAERLRARVGPSGSAARITPSDLPELLADFTRTERDLNALDARLDTPLVSDIAARLPYLGPRLRASRAAVAAGLELTRVARDGAQLGADAAAAYRTRGVWADPAAPRGPTWLDVIAGQPGQIDSLSARFDGAVAARSALNDALLPGDAQRVLAQLDPLLARAQALRDQWLPLLPLAERALGATGDARYLVLLDDSQELHQSGGFPGTYATLDLRAGQVSQQAINNIRVFDAAYVANRSRVLPAPAPIRQYVLQQELLPHDVNWTPDFPWVGQQLVNMNDIAGQPPLAGVVAVEYSVVQDMLRVTGPVTVTVDGAAVTVTADNIITTIETYRDALETHKQVVQLLGEALIARLRDADGATRARIARALLSAANRRELQAYATDPAAQAELAKRGWDGALRPDPATPTLALTVSNLTPNKASDKLRVASDIAVTPGPAGGLHVAWTVTLRHTGDPNGDPAYNGFHRTWLALYLPDGARLTRASRVAAPEALYTDPRERAWVIDLLPGETDSLTTEFDMPAASALLLRRQPGLSDVGTQVAVRLPDCSFGATFALGRDTRLDFTACATAAAP